MFHVSNRERPNSVTVRADEGSVLYQTGYHGPPIENDPRPADHPELTEPYIAYSPNVSVQVICQTDVSFLENAILQFPI